MKIKEIRFMHNKTGWTSTIFGTFTPTSQFTDKAFSIKSTPQGLLSLALEKPPGTEEPPTTQLQQSGSDLQPIHMDIDNAKSATRDR